MGTVGEHHQPPGTDDGGAMNIITALTVDHRRSSQALGILSFMDLLKPREEQPSSAGFG